MFLTGRKISRRQALTGLGAIGLTGLLPAGRARATRAWRLVAAPGEAPLVQDEGPPTRVWAYNGQVPGPVIRARQGERLEIEVENRLEEPTTVHWHGLRIDVAMDGVPWISQPPIAPGGTFRYAFDLSDAGTYWYHPHINGSEQLGRGLHGVLIVEEARAPAVDREVLWVMDDWRLDQSAQVAPFGNRHDASHAGRIGGTITVNGSIGIFEPARAGERIRLRLINVANARSFALNFGGLRAWLMSLDGHAIAPHELNDEPVALGAGMRADVILDLPATPDAVVAVTEQAYGLERSYDMMRFVLSGDAPLRGEALRPPEPIAPNPVPEPDLTTAERHRVVFAGGAMGGMAGAEMSGRFLSMRELAEAGKLWAINGRVPADIFKAEPLLRLARNKSHRIELVNETAFEHPVHLHGHSFRVLSRNGKPEPLAPLRDTVLMGRQETVEIALVADNPGTWMFHCHILEHQESGMMATVEVA